MTILKGLRESAIRRELGPRKLDVVRFRIILDTAGYSRSPPPAISLGPVSRYTLKQPTRSSVTGTHPKDIYLGLRERVFSGSRAAFGISLAAPGDPWGAVLEMGMGKATVTVVALADGNASIYLSSGGGFIGGQSHQSIRQAARKMISSFTNHRAALHETKEHPLPKNGQVTFYALYDDGVLTAAARESQLMSRKHSLTPLFAAAQEIITQYRLIQEKGKD
jgi:hypothetical protein